VSASVFLVEPELLNGVGVGSLISMPASVAHHIRVMRIETDESIELVDGHGKRLSGTVNPEGHCVVASVQVDPQPALRIDVAQALIKGDRLENSLDMLTQVGVTGLIPWIADHSVVRWNKEKSAKQLVKWKNVTNAATEQSRRSWTPVIHEPMTSNALAQRLPTYDYVVVLEESGTTHSLKIDSGSVLLIVGPEGGVSAHERELFASAVSVRLGTNVFRSETAGVVGVSYLFSKSGEWDSESGERMQGLSNA
jgi:16S rRNA (uracil1498-N3)-methyltransferase